MIFIDVNCDVGEGFNNEEEIFPLISSCSVACGAHAGSKKEIDKIIELAIQHNVKIGAHPSFPDKENFGRKEIEISKEELQKSIESQLDLLLSRLAFYKQELYHIKPHGALYNLVAKNKEMAEFFVSVVKKYTKNVYLYVPYKSEIETIAYQNNIKIKHEVFIDRRYENDYRLVSRTNENALIEDANVAVNQIAEIVKKGTIKTIDNSELPIKADTYCFHGDQPDAISFIKKVSEKLQKKKIRIKRTSFKRRYKFFGEKAILIEWESKIDEGILRDVNNFQKKIKESLFGTIQDTISAYNSLVIKYKTDISLVNEIEILENIYKEEIETDEEDNYLWEIPVCYEKNFGIDLTEIAKKNNLEISEIIKLHSKEIYTVYFVGFLPGFLYLGGLNEKLSIKRRNVPRVEIEKGSVAIGGNQTGIYPINSAGGWHIIGKTPISFFDVNKKNPCFAKSGDLIKFVPISLQEYQKLEKENAKPKLKFIE